VVAVVVEESRRYDSFVGGARDRCWRRLLGAQATIGLKMGLCLRCNGSEKM
jgi:hypothetical protein